MTTLGETCKALFMSFFNFPEMLKQIEEDPLINDRELHGCDPFNKRSRYSLLVAGMVKEIDDAYLSCLKIMLRAKEYESLNIPGGKFLLTTLQGKKFVLGCCRKKAYFLTDYVLPRDTLCMTEVTVRRFLRSHFPLEMETIHMQIEYFRACRDYHIRSILSNVARVKRESCKTIDYEVDSVPGKLFGLSKLIDAGTITGSFKFVSDDGSKERAGMFKNGIQHGYGYYSISY